MIFSLYYNLINIKELKKIIKKILCYVVEFVVKSCTLLPAVSAV
jgi:hypothetical protein